MRPASITCGNHWWCLDWDELGKHPLGQRRSAGLARVAVGCLGRDNGGMDEETQERRWCRFTNRQVTIAVFVLAFACLLLHSWTMTSIARARMATLGGTLSYDTIAWSSILVTVDLSGTAVTDADLTHIYWLDPKGYVDLDNTNITDEGLRKLVGVDVQDIYIRNTKVTDEGIAEFKQSMPRCRIFR